MHWSDLTKNWTNLFEAKKTWDLAGVLFATAAIIVASVCISEHMRYRKQPVLRNCTVRILVMVPVYALEAMLGLLYPAQSLTWETCRYCYEVHGFSCGVCGEASLAVTSVCLAATETWPATRRPL